MRAVVVECGCPQRDPLARGLLVTHMAGSGTDRTLTEPSERKSQIANRRTSKRQLSGPASSPFSYGCQGDHSAMEKAVSVLTKPH